MKTRLSRVGFVVVALAGVSLAPSARADTPPSVWDVARDPAARERYRLHAHIVELMHPPGPTVKALRTILLERARAELEAASAGTSPDVRLRFDLGEVYEDLDRHEEAIANLKPALAMAPHHPAAESAWIALALAAAKLDRSRDELLAYDAYLRESLDGHAGEDILSNRAEAEMRLGDLESAIAGYREVIDRIEHAKTLRGSEYQALVLARWGLAVALDRNGDRAEAEHEASKACEEDPAERIIGDQDSVFFVPAYERDWYYALGRAERAKREPDVRRAVEMWDLVVRTWADYVSRAASTERWLPLAKLHLASAESQLRASQARLDASRPRFSPRAPGRGSSSPSAAR